MVLIRLNSSSATSAVSQHLQVCGVVVDNFPFCLPAAFGVFSGAADAFKSVKSALGPINVVINNAGVTGTGLDDYQRVIDINLTAVIAGTAIGIDVRPSCCACHTCTQLTLRMHPLCSTCVKLAVALS